MKPISVLGDTSTHGGVITSTPQLTCFANNIPVCVDGCILACPIHDAQPVVAITLKSFINGLRIVTHGAIAACDATIISPDRGIYVE